jgi:hypothetical protein
MVPEHSDHRLIKGKLNEALFLVRGMFSDEQYNHIKEVPLAFLSSLA